MQAPEANLQQSESYEYGVQTMSIWSTRDGRGCLHLVAPMDAYKIFRIPPFPAPHVHSGGSQLHLQCGLAAWATMA